jgi:hypothetical protein
MQNTNLLQQTLQKTKFLPLFTLALIINFSLSHTISALSLPELAFFFNYHTAFLSPPDFITMALFLPIFAMIGALWYYYQSIGLFRQNSKQNNNQDNHQNIKQTIVEYILAATLFFTLFAAPFITVHNSVLNNLHQSISPQEVKKDWQLYQRYKSQNNDHAKVILSRLTHKYTSSQYSTGIKEMAANLHYLNQRYASGKLDAVEDFGSFYIFFLNLIVVLKILAQNYYENEEVQKKFVLGSFAYFVLYYIPVSFINAPVFNLLLFIVLILTTSYILRNRHTLPAAYAAYQEDIIALASGLWLTIVYSIMFNLSWNILSLFDLYTMEVYLAIVIASVLFMYIFEYQKVYFTKDQYENYK